MPSSASGMLDPAVSALTRSSAAGVNRYQSVRWRPHAVGSPASVAALLSSAAAVNGRPVIGAAAAKASLGGEVTVNEAALVTDTVPLLTTIGPPEASGTRAVICISELTSAT